MQFLVFIYFIFNDRLAISGLNLIFIYFILNYRWAISGRKTFSTHSKTVIEHGESHNIM
jgi:hypothetical protein